MTTRGGRMVPQLLLLLLLLLAHLLLAASVSPSASEETIRLRKVEDVETVDQRAPLVAALWVFGDSVLDAGTNSRFNSLLRADFKPYGQQFGRPTGRFTNGRTYADFLASYAGLPLVEPYLKKQGEWNALLGLNYASAGSGLLQKTNAANVVIPFPNQILQFNQTRLQIANTLKSASAAEDLFTKSLFLINIGSNDLFSYISNMSIPQDVFFDSLVVILKDSIQALYEAGARKLIILGTGPLGCVPGVVFAAGIKDGTCVEPYNVLTESFNSKIEELVLSLNSSFPELRAIFGKPFAQLVDFFTHPDEYGFTAGVTACCGAGLYNAASQCGRPADLITNAPYNLCENVDEHVFWDNIHPTERAYSLITEQFWNGNTTVVVPENINALLYS